MVICRKVYAACGHECGCHISSSQDHSCPEMCQQRVTRRYWNGSKVFRRCGEERAKFPAAYADSQVLAASASRAVTPPVNADLDKGNEKLAAVAPKKTTAPAPRFTSEVEKEPKNDNATARVSMNHTDTFGIAPAPVDSIPVLHLKSSARAVADPVPGPSSACLGHTPTSFEVTGVQVSTSSMTLEETLGDAFSQLPDDFRQMIEAFILSDPIIIDDDLAWKMGYAKCSSGHLYFGDFRYCDTCGEGNPFYYGDD